MKARIFAYITVVAVFVLVFANTVFLEREIGKLSDCIDSLDCYAENAADSASELRESFEKREIFISLTVSHSDLADIEEGLAELAGALAVGEKEEAEIIKSRLKNALLHIRRLSGFNIDGII